MGSGDGLSGLNTGRQNGGDNDNDNARGDFKGSSGSAIGAS